MSSPSMTREQSEARLKTLVERFERHRAEYMKPDYSEAQARLDFVNPIV